jgi:hypothetical protein
MKKIIALCAVVFAAPASRAAADKIVFAPGWNDPGGLAISSQTISGEAAGALSASLDGVAARNISISDSTFQNNANAGGNGGAIWAGGQVAGAEQSSVGVFDTDFSGNSAANGGAIYFASNNSQSSGAANPSFQLYTNGGKSFQNNIASNDGGAVYFAVNNGNNSNNYFESTGYDYTGNTAGGSGGAMRVDITNPNGGANKINIFNGTFSGNTAAANGGAFALTANGGSADNSINISGNSFANNSAALGGAIYNAVGDLYSPYGGRMLFNINSNFTGNNATSGGAVYNYLAHGAETIDFNIAGTYSGNTATADGGAIYNIASNWSGAAEQGARMNIQPGARFENNSAGWRGGAIFNNANGVVNITATNAGDRIIFSGNRASENTASNVGTPSTLGDDIYNGDATSVINIDGGGIVAMTGGFGGTGSVNKLGTGLFYMSGATDPMGIANALGLAAEYGSDNSGFTGTFNLSDGRAYFDGIMFSGVNNIYGTGNDNSASGSVQRETILFVNSPREQIYFNLNMWDESYMQYMASNPGAVRVNAADAADGKGLIFLGEGAIASFMGRPEMDGNLDVIGSDPAKYYLPRDIYNPNGKNLIAFLASDVQFGDNDFNHTTEYQFSFESTLNLAASGADYQNYTFGNLDATDDGVSGGSSFITIKTASDAAGAIAKADSLTALGGTGGTLSLGKIYINDSLAVVADGATKQILFGDKLSFAAGALPQYVITSKNVYSVSTGGKIITFGNAAPSGGFTPPDLGDVITGNVSVDDGTGSDQTISDLNPCGAAAFQITGSVANTGGGGTMGDCSTLNIYGDNPDDNSNNVISGGTDGLADLSGDNSNLNLSDVVVDGVHNDNDGGVINIDNGSSSANLDNVDASNNSSGGDGGVINIGNNGGDVSVGDSTFTDNSAGGNGGAINNGGGNLVVDGGGFEGNHADENGGAISSGPDGGDLSISGGTDFTDNTAGGDGGAIWNDGTLNLITDDGNDMNFSGNSAGGSGDDIYNAGDSSVINIGGDGGKVVIGGGADDKGGFGGTGQINKSGDNTLVLGDGSDSGDFTGSFAQSGGETIVDGGFFGGTSVIGGGTITWEDGATKNDTATLVVTDGGKINVVGGGDLILNNPNDDISGQIFVDSDSRIDVEDGKIKIDANDVINGGLHIDGGTATITGGGKITLSPNITIDGGSIVLDNGTLASGGFAANGNNLTITNGGLFDMIDGKIIDNNFTGAFNVSGDAHIRVDVNPDSGAADRLIIGGGAAGETLMLDTIRFTKTPTQDRIEFQAVDATPDSMTYAAGGRRIRTPILDYKLRALGAGNFAAEKSGYNPSVFRAQTASVAAAATQLSVIDSFYDHIYTDSTDIRSDGFMSWQSREEKGALWAKGFATGGAADLGHGARLSGANFGAVAGADFAPLRKTNYGARWIPSAYIAAAGGAYENITQMSAQFGAALTMSYGTAFQITAAGFGGFLQNELSAGGADNSTGGGFYGASAKAAYYANLGRGLAIVPNAKTTYAVFGAQKFHSDYGDIDIAAGKLTATSIAGGADFIADMGKYYLFAGASYVSNGGTAAGRAAVVELPGVGLPDFAEISFGGKYLENDSVSFDGKVVIQAGADILSLGVRGGAMWRF